MSGFGPPDGDQPPTGEEPVVPTDRSLPPVNGAPVQGTDRWVPPPPSRRPPRPPARPTSPATSANPGGYRSGSGTPPAGYPRQGEGESATGVDAPMTGRRSSGPGGGSTGVPRASSRPTPPPPVGPRPGWDTASSARVNPSAGRGPATNLRPATVAGIGGQGADGAGIGTLAPPLPTDRFAGDTGEQGRVLIDERRGADPPRMRRHRERGTRMVEAFRGPRLRARTGWWRRTRSVVFLLIVTVFVALIVAGALAGVVGGIAYGISHAIKSK